MMTKIKNSVLLCDDLRELCIVEKLEYLRPEVDIETRWNSTYLAWKRVLELHNSIRYVSTSLFSASDHASQKEGEKLERLCLSVAEKE